MPDNVIYLDGNSLGAMHRDVPDALADGLGRQWSRDLIGSWNSNGWWRLPAVLGDRIGTLIGAASGQVICGDSTSVQAFQALLGAARLRPDRRLLVIDRGFPTDQYLADSVARLLGLDVIRIEPDGLTDELARRAAVVSFSLVDYRSGELFDAAAITNRVHRGGALMLWDLSHAAGALPVELDAIEADLAIGCTYKYLNGGPGAPAYLYVARRLIGQLDLPLTGWHGHQQPFGLTESYEPAASIERGRIGTPPILSMLALQAGLRGFDEASISQLRRKSLALTARVIEFADEWLTDFGVEVATPRQPERRGSQIALRSPHAYPISQALIARGVIGDFREPDLLRLGFAPLYLSHSDVVQAMTELWQVLDSQDYLDERFQHRLAVT
ncbi:MAG: kynureninase [Frankiales bacterium]|nr:kynureninase [Frankiales bacterium]